MLTSSWRQEVGLSHVTCVFINQNLVCVAWALAQREINSYCSKVEEQLPNNKSTTESL